MVATIWRRVLEVLVHHYLPVSPISLPSEPGMAVMAAGICQAAIDASISYNRERRQFGRPIGNFQMIQEMIADIIAETEAARLLGY